MTAENSYIEIMGEVGKNDLLTFQGAREAGTHLMLDIRKPGDGRESSITISYLRHKDFDSAVNSCRPKILPALALSMSLAWQNWMYAEMGERWSPDRLIEVCPQNIRSMLNDSFGLIERLSPELSTEITDVSLERIRTRDAYLRKTEGPEILGVFGLNGCGKTTAKNALYDFCKYVGIDVNEVKFPRPGTAVSDAIFDSLSGKTKVADVAVQSLFTADFLDWTWTIDKSAPMQLVDRLAPIDGLVYPGDKLSRVASIASLEASTLPVSALIIDSQSLACFERVYSRGTPLRKFEKSPEMMVAQSARMMALTKLPGVRIVNTDLEKVTPKSLMGIRMRMVDTAISTGTLGRQLVRQGGAESFVVAQEILKRKSWEWYWIKEKSLK